MADVAAIRYRAFLSYSHSDTGWAKWLHRALESFRVDKDLAGRETALGPVPKTLRPIFRDREDFSGGRSLTDATIAALDASAALVVLCSTVSATRPAVNEEVRLFRARHPDRPVIPVVIEGHWPDNFPPALRFELAPDGTVTDRAVTLLGPDLRDSGDGKGLGVAKIVAGLTGLGADDIFRRAERDHRRKARWRNAAIGLLAMLTVLATGSAIYAWQEVRTREAMIDRILKTATEGINEAVAQAERYNVPRSVTLASLMKVERLFDIMAEYGRPTPEMRYRKAAMLIEFAHNYHVLGDTSQARQRAEEAYGLLAGLVAEKSGDESYQRGLAVAYGTLGDLLWEQGSVVEALSSYRLTLATTEKLLQPHPAEASYQFILAQSYRKIGEALGFEGKHAEALAALRTGLAVMEKAAQADPRIASRPNGLAEAYEAVGDELDGERNFAEALAAFRASFRIREKSAQEEPDNSDRQFSLAGSYWKIGVVLAADDHSEDALKSYREGLAIATRLTQADPSNTDWQERLAEINSDIGSALRAQGNLPEALEFHRNALGVMQKLVRADPKNAERRRHLSAFFDALAETLQAQGSFAEARSAFNAGLDIAKALATAAPSNLVWRQMLSQTYKRIGDALKTQGSLDESLESYRASIAVADELVRDNPDDETAQVVRWWAYSGMGNVLKAQHHPVEALDSYREGLAIAKALARANPASLNLQRGFVAYGENVSIELKAQGHAAEALTAFRESIGSIEKLLEADPSNHAKLLGLLWVSYTNVGDLLVAQGNLTEALRYFRTIAERFAQLDPGGAECRGLEEAARAPCRQLVLLAYQSGLGASLKLALAEPDNVERQLDLVAWYRALAVLGDDPDQRWPFIVIMLGKIKAENKLDPEHEKWLTEAETHLKKANPG